MMEDTFESMEDDDVEEAASEEVEKILWEITSGKYYDTWRRGFIEIVQGQSRQSVT